MEDEKEKKMEEEKKEREMKQEVDWRNGEEGRMKRRTLVDQGTHRLHVGISSHVLRPSLRPVFDHLQYAKTEGEGTYMKLSEKFSEKCQ